MAQSITKLWLNALKQHFVVASDTTQTSVKKLSIVIISLGTCLACPIWIWLYYHYFGVSLPVLGPCIYFLVVVPCLTRFFITKKEACIINAQLVCIFTMPLLMEWTSGGFASGTVILWSFLAPVGALMYKGIGQAAWWMLLFITVLVITIVFSDYFLSFSQPVSRQGQALLYGMNIIGPSLVIYFSMRYFVKAIIRNGQKLQENNLLLSQTLIDLKKEKQKTEDLLLNILPYEVAEELKLKGETEPHLYENVSVLFTDFVGFTTLGEKFTPKELITEIHHHFTAFDKIIERNGLEKIKTIGDAYLAVCGLPNATSDHALRTLKAAMEIRDYMEDQIRNMPADSDFSKAFKVRIGIHSGPVVAGIVGLKKFAFDIWGDTVNTAARMEQHGEAGKINISGTTHQLIKDDFSCTYRGKIEAKNKGQIDMYFVDAPALMPCLPEGVCLCTDDEPCAVCAA